MSAKNNASTLHVETVKNVLQAEINKLKNRVATLEHRKQPTQAAGSKKGPKKARLPKLELSEAEQAHLDKMKAEMDKKDYRKAARTYIKELRAGRAPVASGDAIPRQSRAPQPEYTDEDKKIIQVIRNGSASRAEKTKLIRAYQDKIRPDRKAYVWKPRSAQTATVAAAVAKVNAAEGKVDALRQEMDNAATPADIREVAKELGNALEEKATAAADAAAVAAAAGDEDTAEDMKNTEADAVTEGDQLPDAVKDAVTKSQYRSPSFGGGLGRRAMLSRWG
jgi:hypothetical protein